MKTLTILFSGLAILVIAFTVLNPGQSAIKPSWVHELHWHDKPGGFVNIEEQLWNEVIPFRTDYETVNISASNEGNKLRLKVIAVIRELDRPDIYDFVYEDGRLILTGYLLEAIAPQFRDDAISTALADSEIASSLINPGAPTVRRILPGTSEKFYAAKTLLSVTWDGTSALIDPDEHKVVRVWKAGAQQEGSKISMH
jgi:hypothetical protein